MTWKPGQSGNPAGRPKGARDRLSNAVYEQIAADWAEHGAEVIKAVRESKPEQYLQVVARLMPASHEVSVVTDGEPRFGSLQDLTDEELALIMASAPRLTNEGDASESP